MAAPETPLAPIRTLRNKYLRRMADPGGELSPVLMLANQNAGKNVYLVRDEAWSEDEAARLEFEDTERRPLWGIPVSLKDCFDLAGFPTSCGSTFYRDQMGVAETDSAVASRLRAAGAIITGKTHLQQLAYGITGENQDFGDCLQPGAPEKLTGGSSSGAAASVMEGSALAAIGTDTGGSIRVPAALCGLAGFRSSHALGAPLWAGGGHLAESFDTLGWLYRDLRDGPLLAQTLFGIAAQPAVQPAGLRIAMPPRGFLHDCEPAVLEGMKRWAQWLEEGGASFAVFDARFWDGAMDIFAPIQAAEAAKHHPYTFQHFEPAIAERLAWGASITGGDLLELRAQMAEFRGMMADLFASCDYLLLPCCPMSSLFAGADHSETRKRILRYTVPMSLAGLPVVALPGTDCGMQLVGPPGSDGRLLALSAALGAAVA